MAGLKELESRLKSVKNTKKITYAMKLVSTAKLSKAQEAVAKSAQYAAALAGLQAELAQEQGRGDFSHPLMEVRAEIRRIRLLVVGGSRGLCGGYNANVNKAVDHFWRAQTEKQIELDAVVLGKKPVEYFRRRGLEHRGFADLSEDALMWPLEDICLGLEAAYLNCEVDEVYVVYTRFKSALSQTVNADKLLPMASSVEEQHAPQPSGLTLFEPSVEAVYAAVIPQIMRAKVRQACLNAKASEHGSRMAAMDAATKNAGELIDKLNLQFNQLRQSSITAEMLDLIGGAEAIK